MAQSEESTGTGRSLTGYTISIIIHVGFLLICFFLIKIYPPNPPLSSYGLSVNFGTEDQGFGEIEAPANLATATDKQADNKPQEADQQPVTEPVEETKAQVDEALVTGTEESSVEAKEKKPKEKKEKKDTINPSERKCGLKIQITRPEREHMKNFSTCVKQLFLENSRLLLQYEQTFSKT